MTKTLGAVHTHTHTHTHTSISLEDKKIAQNKHREIYLCSFEIQRI